MAKDNTTGKNPKDSRREERRRRRIRNQVIAYLVLVFLIAGVVAGGYYGIRAIIVNIKPGNQQIITSENQVTESGNDMGVISTPEDVLSENEALPEEAADPLQQEIEAYLSAMTLEQKVANLFIVTPESITGVATATRAGEGTRTALAEYAVGGIVYAAKNVQDAAQFKEMVQNTKNMYRELYNIQLWTVVQEEGAVNTLAGHAADVTAQQAAGDIGSSGDAGNAYQAYVTIGSYLKDYEIDVNLGPVCDVPAEGNSFLGNRAFNTDSDIAASMVRSAVGGQMEHGIITCLTSFPGQGSLTSDPANGTAATQKNLEEMRSSDLLPFSTGIEEGAQMVMVSNMTAEAVTGETLPCSLSTVAINDILRGEMGFQGIVITADMEQKAITDHYSAGEAAVMAIQAGADMILKPANVAEAYAAILTAVADGTITEERIDESLMRIYRLKMAD